ncbi:MAG: hypothetical protein UR94_C0021G0007 [Parcubacteria group bacterium GW2011_GWA2_36_10]|nr:MAG: hypothetical protein UR94_C0021G0007 [Parcubacteria group bacterium GW2011_GWA2_36_10]
MARKREKLGRNRREISEDENYIGHWTLSPETKRGIAIVVIFLVLAFFNFTFIFRLCFIE